MNNLFLGKNFKLNKIELALRFKIYNLFNEKYRSVLGRPMPQRNYMFLLMFKF